MKPTICVGGPLAGDRVIDCPDQYEPWGIGDNELLFLFEKEFPNDDNAHVIEHLVYGYEQHCKVVAERNSEKCNTLLDGVLLKDFYTASFLRSCKTVILANPFDASPMPLTLSYGKHHLGEINDSLEFIARGESNENCGRITVIAIIP